MVRLVGVPEVIAAVVECVGWVAVVVEIGNRVDNAVARIRMACDVVLQLAEIKREIVLLFFVQGLVANHDNLVSEHSPADERGQFGAYRLRQIRAEDFDPARKGQPSSKPNCGRRRRQSHISRHWRYPCLLASTAIGRSIAAAASAGILMALCDHKNPKCQEKVGALGPVSSERYDLLARTFFEVLAHKRRRLRTRTVQQ